MKRINISIILIVSFVFFQWGCDKVEEPYIEGNPFSGEYDSELPIRKILLEDFTGFGCTNCPEANEEIHKLNDRYGNHLIPIAIHSSGFAVPYLPGDPDYRTSVGSELGGNGTDSLGFFEVVFQPVGVINRKPFDDEFKVAYEDWSAKIVEILTINKFAEIDIQIENSYNAETREINISVLAEAINDITANLSISLYLIENEVVGKQKDGSEVIEDYEHNHMLRAGINGTWGDPVFTSGTFEAGEELESSYNYVLQNNWNETNCEVVAFIYDTDTKEVFQAEIEPIISE